MPPTLAARAPRGVTAMLKLVKGVCAHHFFPEHFYLGSFSSSQHAHHPRDPRKGSIAFVSEPGSDSGCRAVIIAVPAASHSLSQTLPPALCGEATRKTTHTGGCSWIRVYCGGFKCSKVQAGTGLSLKEVGAVVPSFCAVWGYPCFCHGGLTQS